MSHGVRIVIVDYNGKDVLRACISSLVATVPANIPVTIIDNSSPAPSENLVSEFTDRIEIIRMDSNAGYAGAINKAWRAFSERFIIIANNDLEFLPGWLENLIATAESSDAHAVSAALTHENDSELSKSKNASLNPLLYLIPGIFEDRTKAIYPSGACFLLKKDDSLNFSPVDPEYFLYYEDVYIGFLLRAIGKKVVQCPDAIVKHIGSHSVKQADKRRIAFLQERNRLMTQILFFDFITMTGLSPLILIDSLLKIPQCLARKKPVLATLKAHFWILFNLGKVLKKRREIRSNKDFKSGRILPYLTGKCVPPNFPGSGFFNSFSTIWCRLVGIPVDDEARRN